MDKSKPATHLLTLSMGVNSPEIFQSKYAAMSALGEKSLPHCNSVSVSSYLLSEDDDDPDELIAKETTLLEVHRVFSAHGLSEEAGMSIINDILSKGIFFRERRGSSGGSRTSTG